MKNLCKCIDLSHPSSQIGVNLGAREFIEISIQIFSTLSGPPHHELDK